MEVLFKKQFELFRTNFYQEYNDIPIKNLVENKNFDIFDIRTESSDDYAIKTASEKHPYFKYSRSEETKESFEKNYGNPMTKVETQRLTFVVERNEEKVSMKLFIFIKSRAEGKPYFKKHSELWKIN